MPIEHTFNNPISDEPGFAGVTPSRWNGPSAHTVSIENADVAVSAGIVESKLSLNHPTHAPVTLGTPNGLSLSGQQLSMALAGANSTGTLSAQDWNTFNNKQGAISFPITPAQGGTGVINTGTFTNQSNSTIVGGGTLSLGGFTLTVPQTMVGAGRNVSNIFTATQRINVNSTGTFIIEQTGVLNNILVVDTSNGRVGVGTFPSFRFQVNAPAIDQGSAVFSDGASDLSNSLIGGFGSVLSIALIDAANLYQLAYLNDAQGKIANYQDAGNTLFFDHYQSDDTYMATNYLVGYGGYAFFPKNGANSFGIYERSADVIGIGILDDLSDPLGNATPLLELDVSGLTVTHNGNVFITSIKSGATQAGAGATVNEIWKTNGHATLPNNVLMIGV